MALCWTHISHLVGRQLMGLCSWAERHGIAQDILPVRKDGPGADRQAALPSLLPLHHLPEAYWVRQGAQICYVDHRCIQDYWVRCRLADSPLQSEK